MKETPTRLTVLLVIGLTWAAILPSLFILSINSLDQIIDIQAKLGATPPAGTVFFRHYVTSRSLVWSAAAYSAILLGIEFWIQSERRRFVAQIAAIGLWQLIMLVALYGVALPHFKCGEPLRTSQQQTNNSQQANPGDSQ